jgi:hypothetical protein
MKEREFQALCSADELVSWFDFEDVFLDSLSGDAPLRRAYASLEATILSVFGGR